MDIINKPVNSKKRLSKRRTTGVLVVLALLGVIGGYLWNKNSEPEVTEQEANTETALYLNPQSEPSALSEAGGEVRESGEAVLGEQITEPTEQKPETVTEPESPVQDSTATRVYGNKQLGFSVAVPSNWTIQPANSEVVFVTVDKTRYSIQKYIVRGSQESLRNFLEAQANISGVTDANIVGQQGFAFNVGGIYSRGYAFMVGNNLYYLLGAGIENSAIAKTFTLL